jgi:hypothetical protein
MSTQYKDGSFGETLPIDEAMEEFKKAMDSGLAQTFLVGTEQEVNARKDRMKEQINIDDLADRISELEAKQNRTIEIPSLREMEQLGIGGDKFKE